MLNIAANLQRTAQYSPAKLAIQFMDKSINYAQLNGAANQIANGLRAKGIGKGDKVVLACPNLPFFPMVYYAILKLGAVVVPINVLLKSGEIAYHLTDSEAKAFLCFEGMPDLPLGQEGWKAFKDAGTCPNFFMITADPTKPSAIEGAPTLGMLMHGQSPACDYELTSETDTAVILYTSGTTGKPKGAELSHSNIALNLGMVNQLCKIDINDVHLIMEQEGIRRPVIAKIEKPQAVDNLEEIIAAFDGIMVARGDLGVEMPIEDVPLVQKQCVMLAREAAKPVIVATQMLDSMITNSRPTRAEATDCANAVLDGADALMLSGETSIGEFAIEAVTTMARIIERTEEVMLDRIPALRHDPKTKGGAITKAATEVGAIIGAKFLVAFTQSGDSARRMSRLRSPINIMALTQLSKFLISWHFPGESNQKLLRWFLIPMKWLPKSIES